MSRFILMSSVLGHVWSHLGGKKALKLAYVYKTYEQIKQTTLNNNISTEN